LRPSIPPPLTRSPVRSLSFQRLEPVGALPGTIHPRPGTPPSRITALSYNRETLEETPVAYVELLPSLIEERAVTWIHLDGLGDPDLLNKLGSILRVHALALEDVVNVHQRSKVEEYEDGLFVVLRVPVLGEQLATEQVSLFLGKRFVVTFQEQPAPHLDPIRERLRRGRGRVRASGVDYLAYCLIDTVVDAYFPVLDRFADRLEEIEDLVMARVPKTPPAGILAVRHDLLTLRRALAPLREMLGTLHRQELGFVSDDTRLYLRDCYDHTLQLLDAVETYREIATSLMEVYMSAVSNRMNEVMKVLTIIATMFIPLTFVSSIYGMNFATNVSPWNMPELTWAYGYPFALGLMLAIAVGLLVYFRRKEWL
jgi:magnesium transporter